MKICQNCQNQNSDESVFCVSCGASLPTAPAAAVVNTDQVAPAVDAAPTTSETPVVSTAPVTTAAPVMNTAPPSQVKPKKGLSIAALVLGIIALFTAMLAPVAIICGALAIIFAIIGMKKAKGLAIAGLITGILGLLGGILWGAVIGLIIGGTKGILDEVKSEFGDDYDSVEELYLENEDEDESDFTMLENTQRVGNASVGFVSLPNNFVKFADVEGAEGLQWADGPGAEFGSRIVTLDTSVGKPAEYMSVYSNPEMWASSIIMMMEDHGSTDAEGARIDFQGHDAVQAYATFPNGTTYPDGTVDPHPSVWVVTIFPVADGSVRYLSVEGPIADDFFEFYEAVMQSYSLN